MTNAEHKQRKREYDRVYKKNLYKLMREHGMCPRCNKEEVVPGKFLCARCALDHASYNVAMYHRKREKQLCVGCGTPTDGQHAYCESCIAKKREGRKKIRNNRVAQGLCPKCGGERSDKTRVHCEKCRAKIARSQAATRRKAA